MTDFDRAVQRASFFASWCGAAGFKRARWLFVADLLVLELSRRADDGGEWHSARESA